MKKFRLKRIVDAGILETLRQKRNKDMAEMSVDCNK